MYRVFLAQQRSADQVPVVTAAARALARRRPTARRTGAPADVRRGRSTGWWSPPSCATRCRRPRPQPAVRALRAAADRGRARRGAYAEAAPALDELGRRPAGDADYDRARIEALVASPRAAHPAARRQRIGAGSAAPDPMLEAMTRRYYRIRDLEDVQAFAPSTADRASPRSFELRRAPAAPGLAHGRPTADLAAALPGRRTARGRRRRRSRARGRRPLPVRGRTGPPTATTVRRAARRRSTQSRPLPRRPAGHRHRVRARRGRAPVRRAVTFRPAGRTGWPRSGSIRGMHPLTGQRLDLWRLKNFDGTRLPSAEGTYLFHLVATDNPADERLVALAEVRDVTAAARRRPARSSRFPPLERVLARLPGRASAAPRRSRGEPGWSTTGSSSTSGRRSSVPLADLAGVRPHRRPADAGHRAGRDHRAGPAAPSPARRRASVALRFAYRPGAGVIVNGHRPADRAAAAAGRLHPEGAARPGARGTVYPYEIVPLLTGAGGLASPSTTSTTHGAAGAGRRGRRARTRPASSPGVVTTPTDALPRGHDPGRAVRRPDQGAGHGRRAGVRRSWSPRIDLAEELGVPVEWFALSSGAKISMDSGTENMDGVARALRRIITFTQAGGEINVIVAGINVGAQPYWNAEATMLHAHQGHPDHDPGQRDGADRQAVAGLLRRRLGGGQLRHRRLRPGDGPERRRPSTGRRT